MKPDKFEQQLSRQPLRQVPTEWRAEILSAAREVQPVCHAPTVASLWRGKSHITRHGWLSTLNSQLSTLFWPHPKAWAGLAVVWVLICVLNLSTRDTSPRLAEKSAPPSPEMLVELRKQQRMFAELVGPREEPVADRSKIYVPRPRTQREKILTV